MEESLDRARPETFVMQVAPNATGELVGVIHYVRTREKRRFEGLEELSAAIRGMSRRDAADANTENR